MLFTPMLPEAASGTLEPRHCVVPLRMMCPHAELLLGRATALDEARDGRRSRPTMGTLRRSRYEQLVVAVGSVLAHAADPRPRRPRPRVQRPRRRDPAPQPRPPPARGGRGRADPEDAAARSSRSSSSAPATPAWRRSPSCPTSSATRCATTRARSDARSAGCWSTRRRRSSRRSRRRLGDYAAAVLARARGRHPRLDHARVGRGGRGDALGRHAHRDRTLVWTAGVAAAPAPRASSGCRSTSAAASWSTRSSASRARRTSGRSATARACRTRRRPVVPTRRPPARAPPGPPAGEEPDGRRRSRTATGCSARWRRSAATRGSPTCSASPARLPRLVRLRARTTCTSCRSVAKAARRDRLDWRSSSAATSPSSRSCRSHTSSANEARDRPRSAASRNGWSRRSCLTAYGRALLTPTPPARLLREQLLGRSGSGRLRRRAAWRISSRCSGRPASGHRLRLSSTTGWAARVDGLGFETACSIWNFLLQQAQ